MHRISINVTPEKVFVFVMQLLYVAASSEVSQSEVYDLIFIFGYLIAGFMAVVACVTKRTDLPAVLKLVFLAVFAVVSAVNSAGREFLLLVLFLIVLNNSDQDGIISAFYIADVVALVLNASLSIIGVYSVYSQYDSDCITLGFLNPNFLGIVIFDVVVLLIIRTKGEKASAYIVAAFAGLFCWNYVDCRSSALSIAIIVLFALLRKKLEGKKIFSFGLEYLYIILASISIALGKIGVKNHFLSAIDKFFSGRIIAWNVYFNCMPITLFGNSFYTSDFYPLDNAFLYILFRYGLIVFVIYGVLGFLVAKKAIANKSYVMQIVVLSLSFYSLVEFSPMSVFNHIGLALLTTRKVDDAK